MKNRPGEFRFRETLAWTKAGWRPTLWLDGADQSDQGDSDDTTVTDTSGDHLDPVFSFGCTSPIPGLPMTTGTQNISDPTRKIGRRKELGRGGVVTHSHENRSGKPKNAHDDQESLVLSSPLPKREIRPGVRTRSNGLARERNLQVVLTDM